jgi:ribosome-associated protein
VVGEEGREQAEWILVDLGGVVAHIMLARTRALYSLEDLWNFDSTLPEAVERKPRAKPSEKTQGKSPE